MRGTLKVKQRQHNSSFLCHRPPVSLVKNNRSGESHILSHRYPKHLSAHRPLAHMPFHLSTGFSLTNMGSGRKTQHAIVSTQPQCEHSKLSKVLEYVCVLHSGFENKSLTFSNESTDHVHKTIRSLTQ